MLIESADFLSQKQEVLDWLHKDAQLDSRGTPEPIDENIKPLIYLVNERLPFLYTVSSCEGHLETLEDILKKYPDTPESQLHGLPLPGYAVCSGGYITFVIDGGEQSLKFLGYIRKLSEKYPGSGIENYSTDFTLSFIKQLDTERDAVKASEVEGLKLQLQLWIKDLSSLIQSFPAA